jgi:hypoxanthine phosphoribosyltransferase
MMPGMAEARVLYTEEEIRARVLALAEEITRDYRDRSPTLISVLKGGSVFLADLFRRIDLPVRVDFMSISHYAGEAEESGVVRILKDLDHDIVGQDVILVEDIIDTGLTLSYLLAALRDRGPATLEVCTLLDRSARRIPPLEIRYRGFDCPDVFVVGYGLDVGERFRNLPFILEVDRSAATAGDSDVLLPFLASAGSLDAAAE